MLYIFTQELLEVRFLLLFTLLFVVVIVRFLVVELNAVRFPKIM